MPDDFHLPVPRRKPEDIDVGAIKADLEFLTERTERFRKEQALKPLYTMVGSAGIVIAWIGPADPRPPAASGLMPCRPPQPVPPSAQ
jgi:hypothetical protein